MKMILSVRNTAISSLCPRGSQKKFTFTGTRQISQVTTFIKGLLKTYRTVRAASALRTS
jgi:hypothetical protein